MKFLFLAAALILSNPAMAANTTATAESPTISDEDLKAAADWIATADKNGQKKTAVAPAAAAPVVEASTKESQVKDAQLGKKEADIPVLANPKILEEAKKPASASRMIISLGLVLALIGGFSVFLKKFLKKTPLTKNSQIKVLTQYYLGPKKSLSIIQVAGESMLIGVTDSNINLIKTLALLDEEIPQDTPKDFAKSLRDLENQESDDFAFTKIKDMISGKLKNMKDLNS